MKRTTEFVASWISVHEKVFGSQSAQFTRGEGTLVVRFETPECMIEILAWDFGCLDIIVLNKATENYDYSVTGIPPRRCRTQSAARHISGMVHEPQL